MSDDVAFSPTYSIAPRTTRRCTVVASRVLAFLAILASGIVSATQPLLDAEQVSAGGFHTCAIVRGGAVCWGFNNYGEIGNGEIGSDGTADRSAPFPVAGLSSGVTAIAAGGYHTCAIAAGAVKCWGRNVDGELGNGTTADSAVPVNVLGLGATAVAIYAGGYHTCAVLVSGGVRCWGWNANGQLGDGTIQSTNTGLPTTPTNLGTGVTSIALGAQHSCALVAGTVKCWGYNHDGELANGSVSDSHIPVVVSGLSTSVSALAAGLFHACAIDGAATRCWGYNTSGQLGNGTIVNTNAGAPTTVTGLASATSLAAGGYHTCAIVGGGAKCWGNNFYGQLGNGTLSDNHLPVPVQTLSSSVTRLAAGGAQTCAQVAVAGHSQMRCWGDNIDGELGLGDQLLVSTPALVNGLGSSVTALTTSAAAFHSCALIAGGAWCWGNNADGELGDGTYTNRSHAVAVVGLASGVSKITSGGLHTCAVVNGSAMCWGLNQNGQLGNASNIDTSAPVVAIATGVTAVTAGAFHSCAIVGTGVKCWGRNANGELGDGTTTDRNAPVAVQGLLGPAIAISAGLAHTCAVINNGKIQCWGYNSDGQLGDGSTNSTAANPPVTVSNIASGATALAAGGYHTCAIVNGGARCWGNGEQGALGNGQLIDSHIPVAVVGFASGVNAIVAGNAYSCLVASGAGYCWGNAGGVGGSSSQILAVPVPLPALAANVTAIGTAYEHGCAILGGMVACVGFDHYGQVGDARDVFLTAPGIVVEGDEIFRDGLEVN